MKTLIVKLKKKDIKNIDIVLESIAKSIEDGFTSGIDFPVNWQLAKGSAPKMDFMEIKNEAEITINKLELASEIAHKQLVVDWGTTRAGMYKDKNADILEYSEEAQDVFNDFYNEALTLIEKCK